MLNIIPVVTTKKIAIELTKIKWEGSKNILLAKNQLTERNIVTQEMRKKILEDI